ncbi:MAG: diguanylate cyclase [Nitrospiraceae bacterium]|nr:diguanylate cyclase [Nitrospiraceae bacterium]
MWLRLFGYFKAVRTFIYVLTAFLCVVFLVIFSGIYKNSHDLIMNVVHEQAESYFDLIVKTRLWNSNYGGVYVLKNHDVESNPYLQQLGIKSDMRCEDGISLTMRNPAIMTKEISKLMEKSGVTFHITSLKLFNPENKPDDFETSALKRFEKGEKEAWQVDRSGNKPVYRYMAPLYVEQSCLACHHNQGYKIGDIRGGINVNIPVGHIDEQLTRSKYILIATGIATLILIIAVIYFMSKTLILRLEEARQTMRKQALVDELTQVYNRRFLMKKLKSEFDRSTRYGTGLSLVMIDIDFFKNINDTYGHLFGDLVLARAAHMIQDNLRSYDVLARYGGEEFMIVCPDSDVNEAKAVADRVHEKLKQEVISDDTHTTSITISAGITERRPDDTMDTLLSRVDTALYQAKLTGRDKIVIL